MIFVYIQNKKFLNKIIDYLEHANILFTTNINDNYDTILIGEINKKTMKIIKNNYILKKKIVFLSYLEERNIVKHFKYNDKNSIKYRSILYNLLNMCDLIIVSLPYFKKLFNKKMKYNIIIIERELEILNLKINSDIYLRYNLNKRKKKILYLDSNYDYLSDFFKIVNNNPKIEFIMLGFIPDYYLNKQKKELLMHIPKNIKIIRYYDDNILFELLKIINIFIYIDKNIDLNLIYKTLYLKKNLITYENVIFTNYLIDNKNIYLFDKNNLEKKTNKLINNEIANLTLAGYDIVKDNKFNNIVTKIKNISL